MFQVIHSDVRSNVLAVIQPVDMVRTWQESMEATLQRVENTRTRLNGTVGKQKSDRDGEIRKQPVQTQDRELFEQHLAGDHDGLMELYDRHNENLWLFCLRMLGSRVHAQDILQHLWERVIRLRQAKDPTVPNNVGGYLFRIARNLCLNHIRDSRSTMSLDGMPESEHPQHASAEPSRMEELVEVALQRLPESWREILVLHAYSGYSYEEIAELLEKAPGAIHTTAWRARKRMEIVLNELLEEDDPDSV